MQRRALIGYAVRAYVADGSSMASQVTGYDKAGHNVSEKDDFSHDDGDVVEIHMSQGRRPSDHIEA